MAVNRGLVVARNRPRAAARRLEQQEDRRLETREQVDSRVGNPVEWLATPRRCGNNKDQVACRRDTPVAAADQVACRRDIPELVDKPVEWVATPSKCGKCKDQVACRRDTRVAVAVDSRLGNRVEWLAMPSKCGECSKAVDLVARALKARADQGRIMDRPTRIRPREPSERS